MFSFQQLLKSCALLPVIQLTLGTMVMAATPVENRLAQEKSPYLLQHAHNPIDWFPWGEEAFAKARKENKLIFLSIGYSTCHWCHVMERESFEDHEVAALLNSDFIAIKVDREERPDIDQFYMQVCVSMTGSGGWPLTILMTPDKVPVFAGTYLPKERRISHPGLMDLLPRASAAWRDNPGNLRQGGTDLIRKLQRQNELTDQSATFSLAQLQKATDTLSKSFDATHGGFGAAPKFPRPHNLSFLLQRYHRQQNTELLLMVEITLKKMRDGGIYDHLGFGFHRYSTDSEWLVPHFEKMLYDQAGLARTYLEAWQLAGKEEYAETAKEIFHYLLNEMRDPQGGFYSAEDADSEGVEGRFYVWQKKEIIELLGEKRGQRYVQIFQVAAIGNFSAEVPGEPPGENILHLKKPLSTWAEQFDVSLDQLHKELEEDRKILFQARETRTHPFRDDKVLTAWNGMMISSLALGGRILKQPEYLQAAETAADFILTKMHDDSGNLLRRWRQGDAAIPAFADDYAFLAQGLLDLYRSTFKPERLEQAVTLAEQLHIQFSDSQGRIYDTPADNELPMRTSELYDGATASAGSVTLNVYAQLFHLTGQTYWQDRAQKLLKTATAEVSRYPAGYTQLLLGASLLLEPGRELVIVGEPEATDTQALLQTVSNTPNLSVLLRPANHPETIDQLVPFAVNMRPLGGQATAYLCQNFSCQKPVTEPEKLVELLNRAHND